MCERTVCVHLCVCECMFVMNTTAVIEVDCGGNFGPACKGAVKCALTHTCTHIHTFSHDNTSS